MLVLFTLAHFGHHVVSALMVPLLPFIREEFTIDYSQAGWLISAFTISYGVSQLPGGWLADRISPRIVIAIAISVSALFGLLIGFSTTYTMIIVFLVLLGITGGGYHPAATPLMTEAADPKTRGRVLGFHQIGGTASQLAAPLIALTIAAVWGWRGSFIATAIPTIIFGVLFAMLLGRWGFGGSTDQVPSDQPDEASPPSGQMRRLVVFIILSVTTYALVFSTISFITLFLVDHFGVSKETAAALLILIYSGGIWAGPVGGYLSDRFGRVPLVLATCFIAAPAVYLLNVAPYGMAISATLVVLGMSMFMQMPISEVFVIGQSSKSRRSTILGTYYLLRNGGAGIATPIIGNLIDRVGFSASFNIVAIVIIAVTITCFVFLREIRE